MTPKAVIYIDIHQRALKPTLFRRGGRQQRHYWIALNGGNMRVMARSSESYTNRQDCVDAARLIFGSEVKVYLRQENQEIQLLRHATNDQPTQ